MGLKHAGIVLVLFAFMHSGLGAPTPGTPGPKIDVTQMGGKGDLTKALTDAFRQACDTPGGHVLIPKGEYTMGKMELSGPCKGATVLEVQGNIRAPENPDVLKDSWITFQHIDDLTILGNGVFDGNGKKAWSMNGCRTNDNCAVLPVSLRFDFVKHSLVRDVTSADSKYFHVNLLGCEDMKFVNFNIRAPAMSPNTDGIHIGRSSNIAIENSVIATGDDCISIGDGTRDLRVNGVKCGPGHGISVGSLGKYPNEQPVSGIHVRNCELRNTMNGVRIKTYASNIAVTVTDLSFEDIVVENVTNPIIIDQEYCPTGKCSRGASKVKISKVRFNNIRGTSAVKEAVTFACSPSLPCEDVEVGNIAITYKGGVGAAAFQCSNVKPNLVGKQSLGACTSAPVNKNY